MPVTINSASLQFKDPVSGQYVGIDAIGESDASQNVAEINAAGQAVLDSIPADYTELADDVAELKSAVNHIGGREAITMVDGKYIQLNSTTCNVNNYITPSMLPQYCAVVPCSAGDRFIVNAVGGNASRAWGFVAANGNVIDPRAAANITVTNLELTAPQNAAYLVINDTGGGTSYYLDKIVRDVAELQSDVAGFEAGLEEDQAKIAEIENSIMELVYDDVTASLTTVGNGYYNNPLVMGLTDWKSYENCVTYSYAVTAGDKLIVTGYNYYACHLVYFRGTTDHTGDFIYPTSTSGSSPYTYSFTIPVDGTVYIGTAAAQTSGLSVQKARDERVLKPNVLDGLNGKTWLCMGDSITYNTAATNSGNKNYFELIAERTGVVPTGAGRTGTGYTKDSGGYSKFVTRISVISTVYDIFTIFGSTNDQSYAQTDEKIGQVTDTIENDTYLGYVNAAIDAVYETGNYHLGIISPIPWDSNGGNPMYALSGRRMANALKSVCEYRGIPFLDLFRSSNMQPWDTDFKTSYIPDGTHPNQAGYAIFTPRIEAFIRSL